MDDRNISEEDQALAEVAEVWPPMLFRFYENCINAGFEKEQALEITTKFMSSMIWRVKDES